MANKEESEAGTVQLLQYHRPALTAGDYHILIEQVVEIAGAATPIPPFKAEMNFTVAAERFKLKPTDVHSVFPPDGNVGDHPRVFPHIILNRSTLPWERVAEMEGSETTGLPRPWLALLLFDEDEKPKSQNLTLEKLKNQGMEEFPSLELESGQRNTDEVTVIDVPVDHLKAIMPHADELAMLAHVRHGIKPKAKRNNPDANENEEELAIIITNRLPQVGRTSFAHLVSVEKRFKKVGDKYEFDYGKDGKPLIRLVSLKSWSFTCQSDTKDFQQLLSALNKASVQPGTAESPATLSLPHGTSDEERLLSRGFVLLPHHFRHGDQTASWFHGPLIPGQNTSPAINLPARAADELLRYDDSLSMFDVSYAAAWQLGRLLALQDKSISTSLYQWKRQRAQRLAQAEQWVPRLPFQKRADIADLPKPVVTWFENLRKLKGVPFNYLVSDELMLPAESIRFFMVDHAWLDCMADGALSIGRVTSVDHLADKLHAKKMPAVADPLTGFLLRSEVVSGWPGLLVDGYADRKEHKGETPLDVVRMERLEGGVLLCIFKGVIGRVEIYLKAETLHFGLLGEGSALFKSLRDPNSGESPEESIIVKLDSRHWRSESRRTANVTVLAESLKTKTSSEFALQMVEGAEKVIFRVR